MKKFKRLLIVDDESAVRESLAMGLENMGWDIKEADSMDSAMDFNFPFDAYIIDHRLPDGDGLKLAQSLRAKFDKLPIILYSGYLDDEIRRKALKQEIDATLKKPFKFEEVSKILESITDKDDRKK